MQEELYLGEKIKQARESKGMKQKDFANALELTQAAVSQFESGARHPTPKTIEKICKVLEISREDLVGQQDQEAFEKAMLMRNLKGLSPASIRTLNDIAKKFKE